MSDDSQLIAAIKECYSTTNNARKAELEALLRSQVRDAVDGWATAERLLASASDEHVLHFALHVIEHWALFRWAAVPIDDRRRLRQGLADYIVSGGAAREWVVRMAIKVFVAIGKVEWPHDNPDFFATVSSVARVRASCAKCSLVSLTRKRRMSKQ